MNPLKFMGFPFDLMKYTENQNNLAKVTNC